MINNMTNITHLAFATTTIIILIVIALWSFIWKGLALWKAARNGSKGWFIVLLILNTLGILDILYIYVFSKGKSKKITQEKKEDNSNHQTN